MTTRTPATKTDTLLKMLALERKQGYENRAVSGGLDAFLALGRREGAQAKLLTQFVARLPRGGYAALNDVERAGWHQLVERTLRARTNGAQPSAGDDLANDEPEEPEPKPRAAPRTRRNSRPPSGEIADELATPVSALGRVSYQARSGLEVLGIDNVYDLLWHLPLRHEDFSNVRKIGDLLFDQQATVVGRIESCKLVRLRKGRVATEAVISDETGRVRAWWWGLKYLPNSLKPGMRVGLSGKVGQRGRRVQLESPRWEILDDSLDDSAHVGRLTPIYPLTKGLTDRAIRGLAHTAVQDYLPLMAESLPPGIIEATGYPGEREALRAMHFPESLEEVDAARDRLAFQELLAIQLAVLSRKREARRRNDAPRIIMEARFLDAFLKALPFQLTAAQSNALTDIRNDLARSEPMARLLQGDVGSGKTVVAAAAMLATVKAGHQAVLMAPTEVLAEQHYRTFRKIFAGEGDSLNHDFVMTPALGRSMGIAKLTGSMTEREKREIRAQMREGALDLVVGTHALIEESTALRKLGLAVVDEQHRFGVLQRDALRSKGSPHLLVMTATPIPRTLALTIYGELDSSTIDELPPGRLRVATRVIAPQQRGEVYQRIRDEVAAGNQAFIICPLVEESDQIEAAAATQEFERLRDGPLASLAPRLRLLHGRMSGEDKRAVMAELGSGEASVVVATIVVEVGVDLPDATVMVIEGADRFGLAQLHQLRGRVGRNDRESVCFLISDTEAAEAQKRLRIMERTSNGFELAEVDLETRGPGEYFGTRQAGLPDLRVAKLTDHELIQNARNWANRLLDDDPYMRAPEHQLLWSRAGKFDVAGAAAVH